jgi:hypothetical protein
MATPAPTAAAPAAVEVDEIRCATVDTGIPVAPAPDG